MKNRIVADWDLGLTVDQVLRGQGADPAIIRTRRPALVEAAEWALAEGLPLLEPRVLASEFRVEGTRHERLLLDGQPSLSGKLIVQHLAGAQQVVAMLCTVGPQLEAVSNELMHSDPVLALAMEGVGTAAVEALSTQACNSWETQAAARSLHVSIPLSPGMVGWPVDPGQKQLFDLIDAAQLGVKLTPGLMMLPRMSVSQVIGLGEEQMVQGRTCDYCTLKETCRYQDHYQPVTPSPASS